MLAFGTRFSASPIQLTFDLAVERQFRIFAIERGDLVWDSRFVPPDEAPAYPHTMIYFVLDGTIVWRTPEEERHEGPVAFYVTEQLLEGASGIRTVSVRSWGRPFRLLELRVPSRVIPQYDGSRPVAITLSERVWRAARAYSGVLDGASHRERLTRDLLTALFDERILSMALADTITGDDGLQRVWNAASPFVRRAYFSPTLNELADAASLSTRQTTRHLADLLTTYRLHGRWRVATRRFRLRLAILLLSTPALSVNEVARITGYSSAEALAHALYADGLPSPTELRARIVAG